MAKTIKKTASKGVAKKQVVPLGDKVLIRPLQKPTEQKTQGGIILPGAQAEERQERGVVVAVGKGRFDDKGARIPIEVTSGDQVIYVRGYEFQEIKVDGVDHILISSNSILAITR